MTITLSHNPWLSNEKPDDGGYFGKKKHRKTKKLVMLNNGKVEREK